MEQQLYTALPMPADIEVIRVISSFILVTNVSPLSAHYSFCLLFLIAVYSQYYKLYIYLFLIILF